VELPRNGSRRKLEYRKVRRHKRGKEKNREARREVVERLDEGNMLESKMAQDHRLCLWPVKRLEIQPSCEGGFPE